MKFILLFFLFTTSFYSQVLHHQMFASGGSNLVIGGDIYVSTSVGQLSQAGTFVSDKVVVQQGFQQSRFTSNFQIQGNLNNDILKDNLTLKIYPNPFISDLNIQFDNEILGPIAVSIYDLTGRIIFNKSFDVFSDKIVIKELDNLPSGTYLIYLTSISLNYKSKLIKK